MIASPCGWEQIKLTRRSATDPPSDVARLQPPRRYILWLYPCLLVFLYQWDVCVKCAGTRNVPDFYLQTGRDHRGPPRPRNFELEWWKNPLWSIFFFFEKGKMKWLKTIDTFTQQCFFFLFVGPKAWSASVDLKANINITMTNCLPESSCKMSL